VIVHDGSWLEAIGSGHVIVVDSSNLRSSNVAEVSDGEPVAVVHVVMHALINGCGYHIGERRFIQPRELSILTAGEPLADTGTQGSPGAELL
jgi:cyanophycinase